MGRPAVDQFRIVDRADGADRLERRLGRGELFFRVQLIQVKALGFPVLMQTNRDVELRQDVDPGLVRGHLRRLEVPVIAVQVDAGQIFARVAGKAGRV